MNNTFYIGETITLFFDAKDKDGNAIAINEYEKELVVFSTSIKRVSPLIETMGESTFKAGLSAEETRLLGASSITAALTLKKGKEERIASACVFVLKRPESASSCRRLSYPDNQIPVKMCFENSNININIQLGQTLVDSTGGAGVVLAQWVADKTEIAAAITDQGTPTELTEPAVEMARKIREISRPPLDPSLYYGIERDIISPNSACRRIGSPLLHASLPIQSKIRRCLLLDDGTVNYYLHPDNSELKADGTPALLDGSAGQVMVEIPAHYRRFEEEGIAMRCLLSEVALPGFHYVPLSYRSAYEAAIDRTVSASPKLASVVNTSTAFRGGNNTVAWDGTYRSLLGMPGSNTSLDNFRNYARRRSDAGMDGVGWNCDLYEVQKTCYWLYVVEYANLNCQLPYNPEPTPEGFRQGGLGDGVTTLVSGDWSTFNSQNPFIPCGYTNPLGNHTGILNFTMPAEYGSLVVQVPSYRGLENPFGHLWSWTDGCKCLIQSAATGGLSEFYLCDNLADFNTGGFSNYRLAGLLPRANGYIKEMLLGEFGENMAKTAIDASSVTYFCDQFYTTIPGSGDSERGVSFGGGASNGAHAGLAYAHTSYAPSAATAHLGSRLCFIP